MQASEEEKSREVAHSCDVVVFRPYPVSTDVLLSSSFKRFLGAVLSVHLYEITKYSDLQIQYLQEFVL